MINRPHRWFHTVVVTGAALAGCGEAPQVDALGSKHDSTPADGASRATGGASSTGGRASASTGGLRSTGTGGHSDHTGGTHSAADSGPVADAGIRDASDDFRCCRITPH